jgi:tetratricopeptide (TPR) repeat protein
MYLFVIEAGGLRQMARIHPVWHQQFLRGLDELLARNGYERDRTEGDLLFYSGKPLCTTDAAILEDTIKSVIAFFHDHAENVLGFTVIIDYLDHVEGRTDSPSLDRRLRDARQPDSVYLTDAVLSSLETVVTVEPARSLHRILSFHSEGSSPVTPYQDALAHDGERDRLARVMETAGETPCLWIYGGDRAVMTATIHAAIQAVGAVPVRVQCYPGMARDSFLRTLIRALPGVPVSTSGADGDFDSILTALHESLRDPATVYGSSDHARGELELVSEQMLRRFRQSESRRLLHLADCDLCEAFAEDLSNWFPEAGNSTPVLVSASTAPPDGKWTAIRLDSANTDADADSRSTDSRSRGFDAALRYWNSHCGREDIVDESPSSETTGSYLRDFLGLAHGQVLFLAARTEGLLGDGVLDRFLFEAGIGAADRIRIVGDLDEMGLVSKLDAVSVHPAVYDMLGHLLEPDERSRLERQFARFVLQEQHARRIIPSAALWSIVAPGLSMSERQDFRHRLVHVAVTDDSVPLKENIASDDGEYRDSEFSARIRNFVRGARGPRDCRDEADYLRGLVKHRSTSPERRRNFALTLAEYELARRNCTGALDYCKQAIMILQEETADAISPSLDPAADHLLMARILFSQRRLREASQHLAFAREDAQGDSRTRLVARLLEALRQFLVGNLTRSAGDIRDLATSLLSTGLFEWAMLAWLTTARISFELGEYERARNEFAFLLRYSRSTGRDAPARVARAWMARAEIFSAPEGRDSDEMFSAMEQTPEVKLFRAEAHSRAGRFREALPLLESTIAAETSCDRWPRLGVSWDNGYASIEDLIIADQVGASALQRIATAYRAWSLAETGAMDEAVPLFFELTRGYGGVGHDPHAGLYNYLYSRVLPRDRVADRDDKHTVLGKAVKLVQERTSRIDQYQDKIRFLQSNVWNRELMTAARINNLV